LLLKIITKVLIIGLFLYISVIMIKRSLCGLTADEIRILAESSTSHATVIANCLYKKRIGNLMFIPEIPKKVKEELNKKSIPGIYKPVASKRSSDGTIKYLFRNESEQEFETVLLTDNKRTTVCVSSQSGCRMGCPFCVTGKYGFRGNLSARDILTQVLGLPGSEKVTHVVFMGMGEPMDNIENVLKACNILSAEWGLAVSPRNITVSTVGITPGIKYFLEKSNCNIALSLYSPFPEERSRTVPAEKKYPAHEIIQMMKAHQSGTKRRMSIAYIMIRDTNDTEKHLEGLKALLHGSGIRINLLPYHAIPGDDNISSSPERMQYFKHELVISGISASIRKSKGIDVSAACGLLASGLK
jgi:23S rRNA (adenine2503-C2)-methyltransferase